MAGNGNGHNGRYTCQQFIDAIPGTGGIVSAIAERVGCHWSTAKKYITEYVTVNEAWEEERNRIHDIAENNIIEALKDGDLAQSRWWLQVMRRDEFDPPQRQEITGAEGGAVKVEDVTLTDEERINRLTAILDEARARRDRQSDNE